MRSPTTMLRFGVPLTCLATALLLAAPPAAAAQEMPLHLTSFAVNVSNLGRSGARIVDIRVNRWSTPEEREKIETTLIERGAEALADVMDDLPSVGTIRTPDTLAYDLRYAAEVRRSDGSRRLVIATVRPIGFWEATRRPRSIDYPFTFIEIRLGPDGRGEGKLTLLTRVTYDKRDRVVTLENFANEPVRLNEVRVKN